jgi:TfoX/Sxy family transcriptional regulator of competence genes
MTPDQPKVPKPDDDTKVFFESVVPEHPDVSTRPMFGNLAAFVNGNMFMGSFGSGIFVRLPEEGRAAVTKAGGGPFAPMKDRPMGEYVVLPSAWRTRPARVREWASRSLEWVEELPPKQAKKAAAKKPPARKPGAKKRMRS